MSESMRRGRWAVPAVLAVLAAAGVAVCWHAFVLTRRGQLVDQLSLTGAQLGGHLVHSHANQALGKITEGGVALAIVAVMAVALLRRRWWLALEAAAVIAGANITTQLLKYLVLHRPTFERVWVPYAGNTLPSGHTTAAASALMAAVMVSPRKLRVPTAGIAAVGIVGLGWATMAAQWHRPSDVVAAVLVCLAWAFGVLAVSWLRQQHLGSTAAENHRTTRPVLAWTVLSVGLGVVCLVGAAWAMWTVRDTPRSRWVERPMLATAYAGGVLGIAAVTLIGVGTLMRLVQVQDTDPGR